MIRFRSRPAAAIAPAAPPSLEPIRTSSRETFYWWGREDFLSDDGPDRKCPAVLDATGHPRFLFFGPYRILTPGVWRATVHLELCVDAARRWLALQLGIEPHYSTVDLDYGTPGPVSVSVDHNVTEPGHAQVRLWLKRAAFHGEIKLIGALVERLGDPPAA